MHERKDRNSLEVRLANAAASAQKAEDKLKEKREKVKKYQEQLRLKRLELICEKMEAQIPGVKLGEMSQDAFEEFLQNIRFVYEGQDEKADILNKAAEMTEQHEKSAEQNYQEPVRQNPVKSGNGQPHQNVQTGYGSYGTGNQ